MVGTSDLTPFKKDIDELLHEFTQGRLISFAAFKKVWLSRKFSYIYEGRPTSNSAVFMQGLYAYCIGYMISTGSLSERLGGLYCMYCLYETQPFKPGFKIYLSLGELKHLRELVIDAKKDSVDVVVALVKRMLDRCMFLFGFADSVDGSLNQRIDEVRTLQNKLMQIAYEKLLANSQIEDYLCMDIGAELDLKGFNKMSSEYARAKELALREAAETFDVGDIKHTTESREQVGEKLKILVERWDAQKEEFGRQVGMVCGNETVAADDFDEELERLLSEE